MDLFTAMDIRASGLSAQPAKNSFEQMFQDRLSEQVKAVEVVGTRESTKPTIKTSETSFKDLLKESIEEADQVQKETGKAVESLAEGKTENIHETMIGLENADISFRMMMEVRDKIAKAYEKVMRMQV